MKNDVTGEQNEALARPFAGRPLIAPHIAVVSLNTVEKSSIWPARIERAIGGTSETAQTMRPRCQTESE
jgi:hypothetical protein